VVRSAIVASGLVFASLSFAAQFAIDQLPVGSEVTLPATAKTTVPMGSRVKITSTDSPQTLSIVPVGNGSTFAAPISLAIYDNHQERVKYVTVAPNAPFLYSFKGLSSISIQPTLPKDKALLSAGGIRMQIESDKPVTVAR